MAHTRASLQKAMALAETRVTLDGEPLTIREVSLADRLWVDEQAGVGETRSPARMYAAVIALGTIGADGQPLFTREDIPQIERWRYAQIMALGSAILKLSEALPGDMKSVGDAADAGEPHPEGGAAGA